MLVECRCGAVLSVPSKRDGADFGCPTCGARHPFPAASSTLLRDVSILAGFLILLIGAFTAYLLLSDEAPPPEAGALYQEGLQLYKEGQWEAALPKFREAVTLEPQAGDARYLLAQVLQRLGHLREAGEEYRRLTETVPGDRRFRAFHAEVLGQLGHHREAIEQLQKVAEEFPDFDMAKDLLARVLIRDGQLEPAAGLYDHLCRLSEYRIPEYIDQRHTLFLFQGKLDEARKFREERKASLSVPEHALMETWELREEGNFEEAQRRLQQVLPDLPPHSRLWFFMNSTRMVLALEQGDFERVLSASESVLLSPPEAAFGRNRAEAMLQRLEALLLLKRGEEARVAAQSCVKDLDPEADTLQESLKAAHLILGNISKEEFLRLLETASKRGRNNLWLFAALWERSRGNEEAFKADLERARTETQGREFPYYLIERLGK